jgi:hypothetical protein
MASEQILRAVLAAMHGGKGSGKGKGGGRILGFVDEPHLAGAFAHGFVPVASCDVIVTDAYRSGGSGGSGGIGGSGGPGGAASLVTLGSICPTHRVIGVVWSGSSSGEVCGTSCNWDNLAEEEAAEVEAVVASDDAADAAYAEFFEAMDTENAVRSVRGLPAKDEQDEEEMEEGEEGKEESSEESTSSSEEVLGEECEESGISRPGSADYEFLVSGGSVVGAVPKVKAKGKAVRSVRGLPAKDEQDEEEMEEGEEGQEESSEESTSSSEEVLGEECEESGISWPGSADYEFLVSGGSVVGAVPKVKAKGKGKVKGTGEGKTKVKGKGKAKAKAKAKVFKPTKSKKSRPHGL